MPSPVSRAAAVALQEPRLADAATRAVDFLRAHCWHSGRLLATWRKGRARHTAYLDDYAFLGMGLLRLLEARWRAADLEFAVQIAEVLLEHFEDREAGGFFFTADDHEKLLHRPKPMSDDATPSGNAVATQFLNRLGHLLGDGRYMLAAERALASAGPALEQLPSAHCTFLNALEEFLATIEVIVIRGDAQAIHAWRLAAQIRVRAYSHGACHSSGRQGSARRPCTACSTRYDGGLSMRRQPLLSGHHESG